MPIKNAFADSQSDSSRIDLEQAGIAKRSPSGKLSVASSDLVQMPQFKRDLETVGRIRKLLQAQAASR